MAQSAPEIAAALDYADQHLDDSLEALFALMRVQSVSTDPAYKDECRKAARLLAAELNELGFTARVADTAGHPMVVAHHEGPAPHVLFYGHYDVQPVDPLNLWRRDPFDAQLETRPDGSKLIYGRGASDDKGQLRTFIEACRAWKATTGKLPCQVTLLLEGEEESGSTNFAPFLKANAEELKADFALVCDTSMWDAKTPAVTIGLRGNATGEVHIKAAARDLHSGLYGGPARNPIHVLADALATLHDDTGRVTLDGFYDGVPELTDAVKTAWNALNFDGPAFLDEVGLHLPAGEQGYSILEQMWARPTAEVNGISGGYTGAGFKTVIASEAFAKISFRLVGQQDPDKVWSAFEQHVRDHLPADCSVVFKKNPGSRAITLADNTPALLAARKALTEEWGVETALMASGGSIPIINSIKRELDMDSVMVGFALNDDQIHSPNEKYELKSFHKGIRSWVRILPALAAMASADNQAQAAE